MERLPCEVVRDLLPTYADGLTSETTNALINAHLKDCPDCRAARDAMNAPETPPAEDRAELDYLKMNRRRNRRVLLWSLLGAALLIFSVLATRLFVIGDRADADWLLCRAQVDGNTLTLTASPTDSAGAVADLRVSEDDGVVTVTTRRVLASPLHPGGISEIYTAAAPIRRVVVNDRIVWDEGVEISSFAARLYATRHPYVGDAPANAAAAQTLFSGSFTNELETEAEPCGWTLILTEINDAELNRLMPQLRSAACVLLGLVENLDHVNYAVDESEAALTVTAAETEAMTGINVKGCYESPALLETLLRQTGLSGPVYLGGVSAAEDWTLTVVNGTETPLQSMSLAAYLQGEIRSSETGINADESPLERGDRLWFEVSSAWAERGYTLHLSVTTADGREVIVPQGIAPAPNQRLTLVGSPETGFSLQP